MYKFHRMILSTSKIIS